jgi:hypothetical protein
MGPKIGIAERKTHGSVRAVPASARSMVATRGSAILDDEKHRRGHGHHRSCTELRRAQRLFLGRSSRSRPPRASGSERLQFNAGGERIELSELPASHLHRWNSKRVGSGGRLRRQHVHRTWPAVRGRKRVPRRRRLRQHELPKRNMPGTDLRGRRAQRHRNRCRLRGRLRTKPNLPSRQKLRIEQRLHRWRLQRTYLRRAYMLRWLQKSG